MGNIEACCVPSTSDGSDSEEEPDQEFDFGSPATLIDGQTAEMWQKRVVELRSFSPGAQRDGKDGQFFDVDLGDNPDLGISHPAMNSQTLLFAELQEEVAWANHIEEGLDAAARAIASSSIKFDESEDSGAGIDFDDFGDLGDCEENDYFEDAETEDELSSSMAALAADPPHSSLEARNEMLASEPSKTQAPSQRDATTPADAGRSSDKFTPADPPKRKTVRFPADATTTLSSQKVSEVQSEAQQQKMVKMAAVAPRTAQEKRATQAAPKKVKKQQQRRPVQIYVPDTDCEEMLREEREFGPSNDHWSLYKKSKKSGKRLGITMWHAQKKRSGSTTEYKFMYYFNGPLNAVIKLFHNFEVRRTYDKNYEKARRLKRLSDDTDLISTSFAVSLLFLTMNMTYVDYRRMWRGSSEGEIVIPPGLAPNSRSKSYHVCCYRTYPDAAAYADGGTVCTTVPVSGVVLREFSSAKNPSDRWTRVVAVNRSRTGIPFGRDFHKSALDRAKGWHKAFQSQLSKAKS